MDRFGVECFYLFTARHHLFFKEGAHGRGHLALNLFYIIASEDRFRISFSDEKFATAEGASI